MQVVKNGSTFNGKPLIMKWYHTPKITPKIPSPTSGSMHSSSPVPQHRQLPFKEKSIPASPSSDEPVCWTVWAMYAHVVCYRVVHHGINTLSGLAITFTVICYIFFVKIFSYTENHTKIFMRIILQRKFSNVGWLRATHQHFPNCCCPYILVFVVTSNTTSNLLFTSHLFGTWCDLLN